MSLPVKQGNDFILQKLKVNQIYNHTIKHKFKCKSWNASKLNTRVSYYSLLPVTLQMKIYSNFTSKTALVKESHRFISKQNYLAVINKPNKGKDIHYENF